MSLDIDLYVEVDIGKPEMYRAILQPEFAFLDGGICITHNLIDMAEACGLYQPMWRPEENGIIYAYQIIPILLKGLEKLVDNPDNYKKFNPDNGFGSYGGFIGAVKKYIDYCNEFPHGRISAGR